MQYKYDSFGRMMTITYPDNEEVYYQYDLGGLLKAVYGEKDSNRKEYLYDRQYDEFDRKVVDMFGNGVKSLYGYDSRRQWMSSLYTGIPSSAPFQNITYTHDPVGNITTISQYAPALSTTMGGMYKNVYQYDSLYRLVSSSGNQDFPYTFSASFSPSGKLGTKSTVYSGVHSDLYYGYDSLHSTHQVRSIFDPYNGATEYFWDANGNLSQIKSCDRGVRFHEWDEENRLRLVCGERTAGYYGYDASGQRVYKLTGKSALSRKNAGYTAVETRLDDLTLYPNPYLVISGKGYTKHYYAGAERLATTIGTGGFADVIAPIDSAVSSSDSARLESMRRYYRFKRYPFGQVTDDLGAHSIVDIQWNDSVVLQHRCMPDNPEELDLPLKPVNLLLPIIRLFSEQDEKEDEVYYYHGDHLGSASWITDKTGTPVQYVHYAPYGELIANQRSTSYDERFKFTGKERDTESGYNYHGARFLWGDAGFWLSVDPLADKYPGLTPYLYCNGNPIMLVDPDGREKHNYLNAATDYEQYMGSETYKDNEPSIHIWAHGNINGITFYNFETGETTECVGAEEVAKYLLDNILNNSEAWKKHIEEGTQAVIVLHSCHTGEGDNSIAQGLSSIFENTVVIAPNNVVGIDRKTFIEEGSVVVAPIGKLSEYSQPIYMKIRDGLWMIFRAGNMISNFIGSTKPNVLHPERFHL